MRGGSLVLVILQNVIPQKHNNLVILSMLSKKEKI